MRGTRRKASASSESQASSSDAKTQLTDFFFKSPKSSALASGAWRHSHPLVTLSIRGFYCDTSTVHAREHLRSCLHLTNPCAKRKVLSLTKPKGKIFKRNPSAIILYKAGTPLSDAYISVISRTHISGVLSIYRYTLDVFICHSKLSCKIWGYGFHENIFSSLLSFYHIYHST